MIRESSEVTLLEAVKYISRRDVLTIVVESGDFKGAINAAIKRTSIRVTYDEFLSDLGIEILKSDNPVAENGWTNWVLKVIRNVAINILRREVRERDKTSYSDQMELYGSANRDFVSFEKRRVAFKLLKQTHAELREDLNAMNPSLSRAEIAFNLGWRIVDVKNARERVRQTATRVLAQLKADDE